MSQHRIVSLIPSATEIVAALGCEDQLVGRSHECDFPPFVERFPACTEPKLDVRGSSRQIDQAVKALLRDALSIYRVHAERLRELRPTVIITQSQCEVCAVSLQDVEQAVCDLVGNRPTLVSLEPMRLDDVWDDIRTVGQVLDVPARAETLIVDLHDRLQTLRQRLAAHVASPQIPILPVAAKSEAEIDRGREPHRPRVACIEWLDPLMAAGNWVPELVDIAGGVSVFGEAGQHSPWMEWRQLAEADPDVIVLMPCGFEIARTWDERHVLTQRPGWTELRAVRQRSVYLVDGNQYFNRPGPRLVDSAEILAELLHPGRLPFGYEGTGWQPLDYSARG